MSNKVTITMIKNLLRMYNERRWACIWRDERGVHICDDRWNAIIVGEIKWGRWKYET